MLTAPAMAAVVIDAEETGDDVLFSLSGSMDPSGMTSEGARVVGAAIQPDTRLTTGASILNFVDDSSVGDFYSLSTAAGPLGPSGRVVAPHLAIGEMFSINTSRSGAPAAFGVPEGYVSGDKLSGVMLFFGSSFDSLGVTTGSYSWAGPSDTITLNIGPTLAAVPLPAGAILLLGGLGL